MGKAAIFAVSLLLLVAGIWVTADRYAKNEVAREIAPVADAPDRSVTNDAALRLDEIVEPAGLSLLPRAERFREEDGEDLRAVRGEAGEYLREQLASPGTSIAALPPRVAEYLVRHDKALSEAGDALRTGETPVWVSSPERESPVPDLRGHMNLCRILAVRALGAQHEGDPERAWRELEAAAGLQRALSARRELVCQLVANGQARIIAGTMRRIEGVPPAWAAAWLSGDFRQPFLRSLQWETALAADASQLTVGETLKQTSGLERVELLIKLPWHRLEAAKFVRASLGQIEAIRTSGRCLGAISSDPATPEAGILGGSNLADSRRRLTTLLVHLDGTSAVLRARGGAGAGRRHCSDATWTVSPGEEGTVIALAEPLAERNARALQLPVREVVKSARSSGARSPAAAGPADSSPATARIPSPTAGS